VEHELARIGVEKVESVPGGPKCSFALNVGGIDPTQRRVRKEFLLRRIDAHEPENNRIRLAD
jgi:hypothetical protein